MVAAHLYFERSTPYIIRRSLVVYLFLISKADRLELKFYCEQVLEKISKSSFESV